MPRHTLKPIVVTPVPDGFVPSVLQPVSMVAHDPGVPEIVVPHSHPWGQLLLAQGGMLRVATDEGSWVVPPSRAVWIAPGVVHSMSLLQPVRLCPVRIVAERSPFGDASCRVVEVSNLLRELILALEQITLQDGPQNAPSRSYLLAELILNELAHAQVLPIRVPLPAEKRLKALCVGLMDEPSSPYTLADWARQVGASERTLVRLFEKELGMSFGQWRQQVRLAHAAAMVAQGLPLSQVAEELGYASQSAFSQMFKRTFGRSPSAFFAAQA